MAKRQAPKPTVRIGFHCVATGEERVGEMPPDDVMCKNLAHCYEAFGLAVTVTKRKPQLLEVAP